MGQFNTRIKEGGGINSSMKTPDIIGALKEQRRRLENELQHLLATAIGYPGPAAVRSSSDRRGR